MSRYSNVDNLSDTDYFSNQSPGYIFVKLFLAQAIFISFYAILAFTHEPYPSVIEHSILYVTALDIVLVFIIIFLNSIIFFLVFHYWQSVEYSISIQELTIKNIFKKNVVKLNNIEWCQEHSSPLGKIFNYGTITLYLHGSKKRVLLRGVPYVAQFHTQLKTRKLAYRNLCNMQARQQNHK